MKIKFGGKMSFNIMAAPYESVSIESVLEIEKEIEDESGLDTVSNLQETVNKKLNEDLEKKASAAVKKHSEMKKKLAQIANS